MKLSTEIKNFRKIEPFSFDNKKPKKQNLFFNLKMRNINAKNNNNNNSKLNKTVNEFQKIKNQKNIMLTNNSCNDDSIKILEKELCSINSEKNINDMVKVFEVFQEELINQLGEKYNDLNINKIMKNNFEIIVKYMLNLFSNLNNKFKSYISLLKNKINDNTKKEKDKNNIINNYTNNNNNIIILEENIQKYIMNQEENIVNLINNLSSIIKKFNNEYKLVLINIENNLESFNNKLNEIKYKFISLNKNNAITFNYNINSKNLNLIEINNDIEKIYLTNINLNKEIKSLDNNHKLFFKEAKEIFNNLRISHKIKLKKFQKIFDYMHIGEMRKKKQKSELKYLKLNLNKMNNIRTRNLNNTFNNYLNATSNSLNKNNLNLNLNNSENSCNINNQNNSFNTSNNNIEIYFISQLMLEFFDKLKILQKAIINKEPNIINKKKEFEKYKKEIIKYLKKLMDKNKTIKIRLNIIHEIVYNIISNKKEEQNKIKENNIFKNIINKFMNLIYNFSEEEEEKNNNKEEIKEDNINIIEEKINKFFTNIKNEIIELKKSNEKLNNEILQNNNNIISKNIISKKSLIFNSEKDLSLSFRDKNNINEINNKKNSIEEEDSNKNNITGSFKNSENFENLNINEEIINLQMNLQNRIKYLEEELFEEKNKNLNFFIELKPENNDDINNKYSNLIKLYKEQLDKNKILEEKYILDITNINKNLIKYFQNVNNNINNNNESLNFDYSNFNLNLSLTKAELKELKNKLIQKEEKINELKQKIGTQILIQKEKLYKPLRQGLELLITEINLNDKIKEILKELLNIGLYTKEEILKIFEYKDKNMNIIGLFKF